MTCTRVSRSAVVLGLLMLVGAQARPLRAQQQPGGVAATPALTAALLRGLKTTSNDPGGDTFVGTPERLAVIVDAFVADNALASPLYLYLAANTAMRLERVEQAGFLFYAAQLRKAFDFQRYDIAAQPDGNNAATSPGISERDDRHASESGAHAAASGLQVGDRPPRKMGGRSVGSGLLSGLRRGEGVQAGCVALARHGARDQGGFPDTVRTQIRPTAQRSPSTSPRSSSFRTTTSAGLTRSRRRTASALRRARPPSRPSRNVCSRVARQRAHSRRLRHRRPRQSRRQARPRRLARLRRAAARSAWAETFRRPPSFIMWTRRSRQAHAGP